MYNKAISIFYCAPSASGAGTIDDPASVASILARDDIAGSYICLYPGTYQGANYMIVPPNNGGTASHPVTITAVGDGAVWVDGEGVRIPVYFPLAYENSEHYIIQGINAYDSSGNVYQIQRGNITLKRCVGWTAAYGNFHTFGLGYPSSTNITLRDCAGFGRARKIFSASFYSSYVTFERCWARWETADGFEGPKVAFTTGYRSHHVTIKNCIANWGRTDAFEDAEVGLYTVDNYSDDDPHAYNEVIDCIGYIFAGQQYNGNRLFLWKDAYNFTVNGLYHYVPDIALDYTYYINFTDPSVTYTNLVSVSTARANVGTNPYIYGLYEEDDIATLGSEHIPTWVPEPWPMGDRIKAATAFAGYSPAVDVEADMDIVLDR